MLYNLGKGAVLIAGFLEAGRCCSPSTQTHAADLTGSHHSGVTLSAPSSSLWASPRANPLTHSVDGRILISPDAQPRVAQSNMTLGTAVKAFADGTRVIIS